MWCCCVYRQGGNSTREMKAGGPYEQNKVCLNYIFGAYLVRHFYSIGATMRVDDKEKRGGYGYSAF